MKKNYTEKNKPFIVMSDIVYSVVLEMIIVIVLTALSAFILPVTSGMQAFADDDMVSFTVYYQDGNGKTLHEPKIFYGKAGDKPSVNCDDIEGYEPEVNILTKTLTGNKEENVFTFVYHKSRSAASASSDNEDTSDQKITVIEDSNAPLADGSMAEQGSSSSGNGIADESSLKKSSSSSEQEDARPVNAKIRDLDEKTPLADPGKAQKNFNSVMIVIIVLQVILLTAVVMVIRKHRKTK